MCVTLYGMTYMNFGCVGRNAIVTGLPWLSDWSSVDGLVVFSWQHGMALLEGSEGGRWTPSRWTLPRWTPPRCTTPTWSPWSEGECLPLWVADLQGAVGVSASGLPAGKT